MYKESVTHGIIFVRTEKNGTVSYAANYNQEDEVKIKEIRQILQQENFVLSVYQTQLEGKEEGK